MVIKTIVFYAVVVVVVVIVAEAPDWDEKVLN